MSYKHLETDFVIRTLEVLGQYDKLELEKDQRREVTLLVNLLLGLIIVPKQKGLLEYLPKKRITELNDWGLKSVYVTDPEIKTVKDLMNQLRHSAAHFDITFEGTKEKIETIIFSDTVVGKVEMARFGTDELRIIITKIAEEMVANYKKQNPPNAI